MLDCPYRPANTRMIATPWTPNTNAITRTAFQADRGKQIQPCLVECPGLVDRNHGETADEHPDQVVRSVELRHRPQG